jgi:hypothetical protein
VELTVREGQPKVSLHSLGGFSESWACNRLPFDAFACRDWSARSRVVVAWPSAGLALDAIRNPPDEEFLVATARLSYEMVDEHSAVRTNAESAARKSTQFRLIPRIETFPTVVSFAQTMLGKTVLLAAFGLGLCFFTADLLQVLSLVVLLASTTFVPEYRRFILAVCPIFIVLVQVVDSPLLVGLKLALIASGILLFWCARRWPASWFGRRPMMFLLSGFSLLILLGCAAAPSTLNYKLIWSLVGVAASYVWFIGYALTDRNAKPSTDTSLEIATLRPLWGSSNTPFPKGAAYLRRIEARDEQQLAIVQLKGLKLLAWAILLSIVSSLWYRFFHTFLRVPTTTETLAMSVQRLPLAWSVRWESQILSFLESILSMSIFGHRIIACCRMAGFNALRNTYRPLSSATVAEFFNRFYFYFKELLVDFFFYPTFLRYWKGKRRLRLVFATFAAAFFGNAFFHFTRDWSIIRDLGLKQALENFQVYLFYCFILAAALSISQLRKRGPRPTGFVRGRVLPAFSVGMFYCLLDVFGSTERNYPLIEHLRFLASLFFIRF